MDAAWRRRTRKKTQCPCRWAECADAACASWKKASEQSDAAGKMRKEARGISLRKKCAFRPHYGGHAAYAAFRMNKSGNPDGISASSYPHLHMQMASDYLYALDAKIPTHTTIRIRLAKMVSTRVPSSIASSLKR